MDWTHWHKFYETKPDLQARLRTVCEQIAAAITECPAGPIRIASVCAGDGRDIVQALRDHPRRKDVTVLLLDQDAGSLARGMSAANEAGLARQMRFVNADATLARNYADIAPVDLLLLSGMLGHLRHGDVPRLVRNLRMLCRPRASVIWNRHLVLNEGGRQVPAIRELFLQAGFEESYYTETGPEGFAVGRVQFQGNPELLDSSRVLFEFVGLDQLQGNNPAPTARAGHALWLVICRRGFWRFSRRERSGSILLDPVRASNAENRQKPPGPKGWVQNGLAARRGEPASPIGAESEPQRRRQPVLNPTNAPPKCMTGSKQNQGCSIAEELARNANRSIPERFQQIVAMHPLHKAVGSGNWQPDYKSLNLAANRLAHRLIARGGVPGDRLALLFHHETSLIAAILAGLKAGRIALVLNPGDPATRLMQICDDAEVGTILTNSDLRLLAETVSQGKVDVVDCDMEQPGPEYDPEIRIPPDSPAFLIYTSGTTGRPKGVIQTHRNIIHNALRLSHGMGIGPDDRLTLFASPSGGQGVNTLWCALLNGAMLCPFPVMDKGVTGLAKWINEHGITVLTASTSLFRSFIKSLSPATQFPGMRVLRLASDPATVEDFASFRRHFSQGCLLLNTLSSSETGNLTQHRLKHGDTVAGGRLPVGKAAPGIEILLVDPEGVEVANGKAGEILVRSRYLSPGYWRDEPLSALQFSKSKGSQEIREFRGGDLARRSSDGTIEYLGRNDAQVKIRGFRVELSEVEETLAMQPGIEQAIAIFARTAANGVEPQLFAFLVCHPGQTGSPEALREALRKALPSSMIPSRFIFLNQFPLTPHGKIDRECLLQLALDNPIELTGQRPVSPTEIRLAEIWENVFTRSGIGPADNFFDLGGDSLYTALVASHLHAEYGVEVQLRDFADHPTLSELARAVDQLCNSRLTAIRGSISPVSRDLPLPLSFEQERIFKNSQTPQDLQSFTISSAHLLRGPVDATLLHESMNVISLRHEILRTTFELLEDRPVQVIHPPAPVPLQHLDVSNSSDPESAASEIFQEEANKPLDLKHGPLLRFLLIKLRDEEHWLLRINHHIISDGWSWKIYFKELALVYEAGRHGRAHSLPEIEPIQYADYAAWQRRELDPKGSAFQKSVEWWKRTFQNPPPPLNLPFSRRQPAPQALPADGIMTWGVDHATSINLSRIAREAGATDYVVRLAALSTLLAEAAGHSDVILGTYVTTRNHVDSQNLFGFFSNLVTLRLHCKPAITFQKWVTEIGNCVAKAQENGGIPYELLCEELRNRGLQMPEIQLIFAVNNTRSPVHFDDLALTWLKPNFGNNMPWGFSMTIDLLNEQNGCETIFDARLYDPVQVQEWTTRYGRLLTLAANSPDLTLQQLLRTLDPDSTLQEQKGPLDGHRRSRPAISRFFSRLGRSIGKRTTDKLINRCQLGVLHQHKPHKLRLEKFPKPSLPESALPSISIVTPSYMQGEFLEHTIQSILCQEYPGLGYVIQDGGSHDNSVEIIRRYESKLTGWESAHDGGQAVAVRNGFEKTNGEIMAWLNSDDLLMPGTLRYAGEYFATHPNVDVIYGHRIVINEQGDEVGRWVLPPHYGEILNWADYVPQETLFWRRTLWDKVGGVDPSFRFALDWDLLVKFQNAGSRMVRVPYFLGCFRTHPRQKTCAEMVNSTGEFEMARILQSIHGRKITRLERGPHLRRYCTRGAISAYLLALGIQL